MICTDKNCFSPETVRRLAVYLQNFERLIKNGVDVVSSGQISKLLNVSPEQFRKDLSYFGEFGKRGVGYQTESLVYELKKILGLNQAWQVALVGVGRLGCALLNSQDFSELNVRITAAFDSDKKNIDKTVNGIHIHDIINFKKIIKQKKIRICVISVPLDHAQAVTDLAVESGIEAILNFAPVILNVPENIHVSNMDIYCELERLIFFLNK